MVWCILLKLQVKILVMYSANLVSENNGVMVF